MAIPKHAEKKRYTSACPPLRRGIVGFVVPRFMRPPRRSGYSTAAKFWNTTFGAVSPAAQENV